MGQEPLSREKFLKYYLSGRRDFSGIAFEEGTRLSGYIGIHGDKINRINSLYDPSEPLIFDGSSLIGLVARNIEIPNASLCECDLREADLSGANLEGALFCGSNLAGGVFVESEMSESNFEAAVLCKANFQDACALNVDFTNADMRDVFACGAGFGGSCCNNTDLRGARLDNADLCSVGFVKAMLNEANLACANVERADFSYANIIGVKNLHRVKCLGYTKWQSTVLTPREEKIIVRRIKAARKKGFIVEKPGISEKNKT